MYCKWYSLERDVCVRLRTDVCLSDRHDNCSSEPHWPVGRYSVTGEGAFAMQKQSFEEGVQHKRCRFLAKKELEKKKSFSKQNHVKYFFLQW